MEGDKFPRNALPDAIRLSNMASIAAQQVRSKAVHKHPPLPPEKGVLDSSRGDWEMFRWTEFTARHGNVAFKMWHKVSEAANGGELL